MWMFNRDAVAGEEVSGGSEWVSFTRPVRRAAGSEWVSELHWRMCGPQTRPLADADLQNFLDPQTESWSLVDLPHSLPFPSPATNGRTAGGRLRRPVVCHSGPPTILLWLELAATTTTSAVTVVVCMHASGGTKTTINTARLLGFHWRT